MPPRDFLALVKAKLAHRKEERQFIDRVVANQTAYLLNLWSGTDANPAPFQAERCMAFDWENKTKVVRPEEMTDEMMEEFDRNMDSWEIVTREARRRG
jgi:hypothetical protein